MSTITIDQLEPHIAKQLERRAAQHGHTLEAEIKAILKSVLAPKKPSNIDCNLGNGDYTKLKEKLFAGETVDTLYEKIKVQENTID